MQWHPDAPFFTPRFLLCTPRSPFLTAPTLAGRNSPGLAKDLSRRLAHASAGASYKLYPYTVRHCEALLCFRTSVLIMQERQKPLPIKTTTETEHNMKETIFEGALRRAKASIAAAEPELASQDEPVVDPDTPAPE